MPFTIPSLPSGLLFFLEPPCVRRSGLLRPNSRLLAPTHGVSFTVLFPAPCISPCGAPGPPSGLLCVHAVVHLAVSGQEVPEHVLVPQTRASHGSPPPRFLRVSFGGRRPSHLVACSSSRRSPGNASLAETLLPGLKTAFDGNSPIVPENGYQNFHHTSFGAQNDRCRCVICVSFIRRGRVPRAKPPSQRGRGLTWPEGLEGSCEQCGCCCWEC